MLKEKLKYPGTWEENGSSVIHAVNGLKEVSDTQTEQLKFLTDNVLKITISADKISDDVKRMANDVGQMTAIVTGNTNPENGLIIKINSLEKTVLNQAKLIEENNHNTIKVSELHFKVSSLEEQRLNDQADKRSKLSLVLALSALSITVLLFIFDLILKISTK